MSLPRSLRQARATSLGDLFLLCCLKLALVQESKKRRKIKHEKEAWLSVSGSAGCLLEMFVVLLV